MRLRAWMAENSREWGCEYAFLTTFRETSKVTFLFAAPGCEVNIGQVGAFPFFQVMASYCPVLLQMDFQNDIQLIVAIER